MSAAARLLILALAVSACGKSEQPSVNQAAAGNELANADIEALPADESAATSSEELVNGATEPEPAEVGNAQ